MLLYDNRNRFRILFQIVGSIYVRTWKFFLAVFCYSIILNYIAGEARLAEYVQPYIPNMDNPFVASSSATLLAFSVSFRTNIAWSRFWEACQQTSFMWSKWTDAFLQLMVFINATCDQKNESGIDPDNEKQLEDVRYLLYARGEITHYFSVLSAMACNRLVRGDIRRMEKRGDDAHVKWKDQIVAREQLEQDMTGHQELCGMKANPMPKETKFVSQLNMEPTESMTHALKVKQRLAVRLSAQSRGPSERKKPRGTMIQRGMSLNLSKSWESKLSVIGELSMGERRKLDMSQDRVALVLLWVNETISVLQPKLNTPAPILSRVYQELSNGALGFSQAEKLSDIPFPFIFAQLLNCMLITFTFISPLIFIVFTGVSWMTPFLSTLTVFNFWALNEIAKELENPFGDEPNNVPVVGNHERFVEVLMEMHISHLPSDRSFEEQERKREALEQQLEDSDEEFDETLSKRRSAERNPEDYVLGHKERMSVARFDAPKVQGKSRARPKVHGFFATVPEDQEETPSPLQPFKEELSVGETDEVHALTALSTMEVIAAPGTPEPPVEDCVPLFVKRESTGNTEVINRASSVLE